MRDNLHSQEFNELVNTLKMLCASAVQRANSGHPGLPLGMADCAAVLWQCFLKFNPRDPDWINRDRFILSAGHGSMLLYALLNVYGFDLSMDEIKNFRQLGSKTPGHPEFLHTPGVDCTTGPLGQGFANGVGMAISQKIMQEKLGPDFSHKIYALVSDGDLMEGVSYEAASLAGHLGLDNLIYIYDDNRISIDGATDITFTENIQKRFEAQNWFVQSIDGHDRDQIFKSIQNALEQNHKPSLIIARTHIAHGAPTKQDSNKAHGEPLGVSEIDGLKKNLNWTHEDFVVPERVKKLVQTSLEKNLAAYNKNQMLTQLKQSKQADLSNVFHLLLESSKPGPNATRVSSSTMMQKLLSIDPNLVAGSADLASSTKAVFTNQPYIRKNNFNAPNIHYGIREHAMAAIMNGMAYHGWVRPIGSTFLVFSDYMRPAIRVAALAKLPSIFIFTHDSIFVGEDGPTHQPIEHIASLRLIPNLEVYRPANDLECAASWHMMLNRKDGPSVLCLTRQNLPNTLPDQSVRFEDLARGAYVFKESPKFTITLASSGSELALACQVHEALKAKNISSRVVSVFCHEKLNAWTKDEIKEVFQPHNQTVFVIEALKQNTLFSNAHFIGLNSFGMSAPGQDVAKAMGLDANQIAQKIMTLIA